MYSAAAFACATTACCEYAAPVIGLPIRTTPAHCPMAPDLGALVGFFVLEPQECMGKGWPATPGAVRCGG
jgi:hypothetical protein